MWGTNIQNHRCMTFAEQHRCKDLSKIPLPSCQKHLHGSLLTCAGLERSKSNGSSTVIFGSRLMQVPTCYCPPTLHLRCRSICRGMSARFPPGAHSAVDLRLHKAADFRQARAVDLPCVAA